MKLFSTNTIAVPQDLSTILSQGEETRAPEVGMFPSQVNAIWQSIEHLYKTGNHPFLSFCLRRQGKIVLNRSLGYAQGFSPEQQDASQALLLGNIQTPVCLFSASKLITAMLVHVLNQDGHINLLDPVSRYVPEFGKNGKRYITIFQLLAHRAGFPRPDKDTPPETLFHQADILQRLYEAKPVSISGSQQAYHAISAGYILGEMIERVTGQTLHAYLDEKISQPMGMRHFNYGLSPALRACVAKNHKTGLHSKLGTDQYLSHLIGGDLQTAVDITNDPRFMEVICPAANIFTTAEEMGRFMEMLLNGGEYQGKQIMTPETVFRATLPTSGLKFDHSILAPMRYALGPMLGENPIGLFGPHSKQAFGHLGFSNILCWADPQRDISVTLLTTGKSVIGTHLPALAKVLFEIAKCPQVERQRRRAIFASGSTEQYT